MFKTLNLVVVFQRTPRPARSASCILCYCLSVLILSQLYDNLLVCCNALQKTRQCVQGHYKRHAVVLCRSRSKERRLESMNASLDDSMDASLDAAAADGAGPSASLVELSLDEDKVHALISSCKCIGVAYHVEDDGVPLQAERRVILVSSM